MHDTDDATIDYFDPIQFHQRSQEYRWISLTDNTLAARCKSVPHRIFRDCI